jgi:hypothetical protein
MTIIELSVSERGPDASNVPYEIRDSCRQSHGRVTEMVLDLKDSNTAFVSVYPRATTYRSCRRLYRLCQVWGDFRNQISHSPAAGANVDVVIALDLKAHAGE